MLPLIQVFKIQFCYWKVEGRRDDSLSTAVPIPQAPQVHYSKVTSQGMKAQWLHDINSQPQATWWRMGNCSTNPSTTTHWQHLQRCQVPRGLQRLGTPLLGASLLLESTELEIGVLMMIQHLSGKKPFSSNRFLHKPSQNTGAFIPQAVLSAGEILLFTASGEDKETKWLWVGSLKYRQGSICT